jgi:hypothetical protein
MTDFIQLIGGSQSCGATAYDGDLLAGSRLRRIRFYPALLKTSVDDRILNILDRNRRVGNAQHACTFAWRRANATREFWEIVRLVKSV